MSVVVYGMPLGTASATALYGAAYGFLPIGWIVLNAVFLYNLTVETGQFEVVKASVGRLSRDRRIQALLVAFSFGAFIEGASGFGTPVAICSALLIGLGFTPLYAAGLSLIANTAPVAFGAIGTPILTLAAVTGIPAMTLGMMAGRQLPFVSLIVPAWLVVTMSGWRGLRSVVAGRARLRRHVRHRAVRVEQLHRRRARRHRRRAGVDLRARSASAACGSRRTRGSRRTCAVRRCPPSPRLPARLLSPRLAARHALATQSVARAWMPWVFLSVAVIVWGLAPVKAFAEPGRAGARVGRAAAAPHGLPRLSRS